MTAPSTTIKLRVERLEHRALPAVNISVNAAANLRAIDPLIYGTAYASATQLADLNATNNRWGGNATTRYNWQSNASNRAANWYYESLPDSGSAPSASADAFVNDNQSAGAQTTLTVPTIGWVARLGPGRTRTASYPRSVYANQTSYDPWWSEAGNGQTAAGPIQGTDPNRANQPSTPAFQQGWFQHLVGTFGNATAGGVRYYAMDNEPSLWHSTHRDAHPNGAPMAEIRDAILNYAAALRAVDPGATILGPEEWGWSGYFLSGMDQQYGATTGNWGNLPDQTANGGAQYMPWLLSQLRAYDLANGTRSLDAFTLHYYPQGGEFSDDVSQSMQLLRNRSTRSLWDATYVDQSWIGTTGQPDGGRVRLVPRMQAWVAANYPGLKTGLTEYNWGAEGHMNGATTQADILGILGREGLDMANRWTTPATNSPTYLAMKLYRNYDGQDSTFGETSVQATVPNPDQVSSFASLRADGALTVMVVNKNLVSTPGATTQITVNLSNFAHGTTAQVWRLAATNSQQTSASIAQLANATFSADSLTFDAPMQSVTLFVIAPAATTPAVQTIVIGDGTAQRSAVRSLTVTFNSSVTFDTGAFALQRGDGATVSPTVTTAVIDGRTVATLTFAGANTEFGSLADGRWTLTVLGSHVHAAGNPTLTMAGDATAAFHRLFGDANGDATVNAYDFGQFRPAYGSSSGGATYVSWLDFDNDGSINGFDFGMLRNRFGVTLP